ncbi:hypothetical protein Trydic_g853 [Trypoxylus dichotomus]
MKFLIFATLLGFSSAVPATFSLQEDLQRIVDLIPLEEMKDVARRYFEVDPEFQLVVEYLRGPEWHELVDLIGENETWQRFKVFMYANGIDIDAIIEAFHEFKEGNDHDHEHDRSRAKGQRTVRDFLDEIRALVDVDAILYTIDDLLNTSPAFQEFFAIISGEESRQLVADVSNIEELQRIVQRLDELGMDVDFFLNFIYGILGWN